MAGMYTRLFEKTDVLDEVETTINAILNKAATILGRHIADLI